MDRKHFVAACLCASVACAAVPKQASLQVDGQAKATVVTPQVIASPLSAVAESPASMPSEAATAAGALAGVWRPVPSNAEFLTLNQDGTADMMGHNLTWRASRWFLYLTDVHGHEDRVAYVLQGDQLDLMMNGENLTLLRVQTP